MECILKEENSKIKVDGMLKKEQNNYYIYLQLKENIDRKNSYEKIYTYDENARSITLVNCYFVSSNHDFINNISIYKYKVNYIIDGWIENIYNNDVKQIYLYFYELDKVFIKDKIKQNIIKNGLKVTVKGTVINLFENNLLKIEIYKFPNVSENLNRASISTPAKVVITFKKDRIKYVDIFDYVRKIENIFRVYCRKKIKFNFYGNI